jgi:hypothetical protein
MEQIVMVRGDTKNLKISVKEKDRDTLIDFDLDDVFFTVKRNFTDVQYKFQKRYSEGTITKDENGYYHLTILPKDTNGLAFGKYVFDVEILKGSKDEAEIKKTLYGELILENESTHAGNEE